MHDPCKSVSFADETLDKWARGKVLGGSLQIRVSLHCFRAERPDSMDGAGGGIHIDPWIPAHYDILFLLQGIERRRVKFVRTFHHTIILIFN